MVGDSPQDVHVPAQHPPERHYEVQGEYTAASPGQQRGAGPKRKQGYCQEVGLASASW
jgi:hypothetical protein